jgi:hypothetical protein
MHIIKIALIADSNIVSIYDYDLVLWAQAQSDLEVSHIIVQHVRQKSPLKGGILGNLELLFRSGCGKFLQTKLMQFIYRMEFRILSGTIFKNHMLKKSLQGIVPNQIDVTPIVSPSGFVYRYSDEDLKKIRNCQFDILLRCGSGILKGDILSASRLGILSFHHGDNRVNRGMPPGFWEVYHKQVQTGFIIQKLTEELDGGEVLARGATTTRKYWLINQAVVYQKSYEYLKRLLKNISECGELPCKEENIPYSNILFKNPQPLEQFKYIFYNILSRLQSRFSYRILGKRQNWGVAYQQKSWRNTTLHKSIRINPPTGHFLADPFVVSKSSKDFCFVEDFDFSCGKGRISVYELFKDKAVLSGIALEEDFHLSFPFIFEYDGRVFMVPETHEARQIRLYESVEFPLVWQFVHPLMVEISAADTMIFEHSDLWWLFTNIDSCGGNDHSSELHIYYSEEGPLTKNWKPHRRNPVFTEPSKARNGGILHEGGKIFRVSQVYGFNRYGIGCRVHEIQRLTTSEYYESEICEIKPHFFNSINGIHHFHSNGKWTIFDFCKDETPYCFLKPFELSKTTWQSNSKSAGEIPAGQMMSKKKCAMLGCGWILLRETSLMLGFKVPMPS